MMRQYLRVCLVFGGWSGFCHAQTATLTVSEPVRQAPSAVASDPGAAPAPQATPPSAVAPTPHPTVPERRVLAPLANTTESSRATLLAQTQPPIAERRWYGWQTLLADATAIGVGVAGANQNSLTLGLGGLGLGLLATPTIHAAHGHWARAGASLGMRAAVPLFGYATLQAGGGLGAAGGAIALTAAGAIAAALVDAAVLAYDKVEPNKPSIQLTVSATRESASVRVLGTF